MSFPVVSPGALENHRKTEDGLFVQTENAFLQIRFFSQSVVNVRLSRTEDFDLHTYAVIREPDNVAFEVESSDGQLRLTGEKFSLIISGADARIRMENLSGEVINEDEKGLGTSWNGQQVSKIGRAHV